VGGLFGQLGYFFNIIFAFPIFNILMVLYRLFGDFGVSIVIMTIALRLILFPLTLKQLRSTKATQALQPLMADIKKKYANDPQAQYRATQELYKEYKINPLAGCLPLFIQLPILYGLYGAMDIVFRPANTHLTYDHMVNNVLYPFIHPFSGLTASSFGMHWFGFIDLPLATPDHTFVLPIIAGLATFAQLRMSQARNQQGGSSGGMMGNQMQIMSFIMPFVTFFFALEFPAGLALYWSASSIFSMVQQYFVTGWGSLFTMPSFSFSGNAKGGSTSGKATTNFLGETRREKPSTKVVDSNAEALPESGTRSSNYSNNSSTRRRRPNSSSARRRGNTPRRNPSRS
jgi:YidC/Oxa1 family membrane protein insertase